MFAMGMTVRAEPAPNPAEIQQEERVGDRVDDPPNRDQHATEADHDARAELVDEVAFDRDQPGLGQDKNRECHLNGRSAPVELRLNRPDEQGPAVLQIGDHHHADDAEDQLAPPCRLGCRRVTH
jgi:hypothetical protein